MKLTFLKKLENQVRRSLSYPCVGDLVQINLIESEEEKVLRRVFWKYETQYVGIIIKLFVLKELGRYDKDCAEVFVYGEILDFPIKDYKFKVIK